MAHYNKIIKGTERHKYLAHAVPYGGHLMKTPLRPPLYEANVDVFIVGNNLHKIAFLIQKFLGRGNTVFFHLQLSGDETFTDESLKDIRERMSTMQNRDLALCLPYHCSVFDVSNQDELHMTQIYDYSDSNVAEVKKNKDLMTAIKLIEGRFKKEKMVWFGKNLPDSIISPVWSKRVITPKRIIREFL